jgi:hypothetical protein
MTLPNEWFISMKKNRQFLFDLLDPTKTPKVPKEIRKRASECLKHFPMDHEIQELEMMYDNSHKDKGIIIGETNRELQKIAGEAVLVNSRLTKLSAVIQDMINKP